MYRKPKFLEILHAIREQMSREVDYDVELFAEMTRSRASSPSPGQDNAVISDLPEVEGTSTPPVSRGKPRRVIR